MSNDDLKITLELTPNPDSIKYAINRELIPEGAEYFRDRENAAQHSALAAKLFDLGNIEAVLIGPDFVSVRVASREGLRELNDRIMETIRKHLESGEAVCSERTAPPADDDETVGKITQVIDEEIRPAVARDGGDIVFEGYRDGVVFLSLQGACKGCPGAAMTLKMGVESRLKDVVPEIDEVIAIN